MESVRNSPCFSYIFSIRQREPPMPIDEKPSKNEEEYFGKRNLEIIHEMRLKLDAERKKAERKAHHNKCPRCGADLKEKHAEQVKIDECAECGGGARLIDGTNLQICNPFPWFPPVAARRIAASSD